MIFKIKPFKDEFVEKSYKRAMEDLNKFFGFTWTKNCPNVFIVDDRKTIDGLVCNKAQSWLKAMCLKRGWNPGADIYLLDKSKVSAESTHKFSEKSYASTIKHELCHAFFAFLSHGASNPVWLNEGVSSFVAEQLDNYTKVEKFESFLGFHDKRGSGAYRESGLVVKILFDKFGKAKLLKLIKSLKKEIPRKEFNELFFKLYGFELNYKEMNKLLESQNEKNDRAAKKKN